MPTVNLSPLFNDAQLDASGNPYTGAKLFTYAAGSTTKTPTYTTSAGTVAQANPIVLNSRGEPASPIWLTDGTSYKFVYTNSGDSDPPLSPIRTIDNITGINDVAATSQSEWVASGLTPTYVSSSSFTLSGDQTTEFHVGRRLKITDGAGTDYAAISKSSFSVDTTTVTIDAATLTTPVTAVSLGINSAANTSMPLPDTAILAWNGPLAPHENLVVTRPTAATLTITADKLVVANTSGRKSVLSSVSVTPSLAAAGANGLDTGSEAASTWYHAWVIWNGATVAGLLSTSATAPTLPSGYTHKAYVGADYNDSGSNLIDIYQRGNEVARAQLQILAGGNATSRIEISITAAVPPTAKKIRMAGLLSETVAAAADYNVIISPSNATAFAHAWLQTRGQAADVKGSGAQGEMMFISGAPALWYVVNAAGGFVTIDAVGWEY